MKKLLSFIFICFFITVTAQDKANHEKKKYIAPDGKLYWPGETPIYIFLSDNPEGKEMHRLKSQISPEYTDPLILDTEGSNWLRSRWAYKDGKYANPKKEVIYEIFKDSYPPQFQVVFDSPSKHVSKEKIYYGNQLEITVEAQDALSGLGKIMVSENGAPYQEVTGSFSPKMEQNYVYKIYTVDNVGNDSDVQTFEFNMDLHPPKTDITIEGEKYNEVISPKTTFTLTSVDVLTQMKEIRYHFDDLPTQKYTGKISVNQLKEGKHTFFYYGIDNVGNVEEKKSFEFILDKTPPQVLPTVIGEQYQNRGRVFVSTRSKIKLDATDSLSGIKKVFYQIDTGSLVEYQEPFSLPKKEEHAKLLITFHSVDNVGNDTRVIMDESKIKRTGLDLDITPPTLSYQIGAPKLTQNDTLYISSKTQVTLIATDSESGIKTIGYKVDDNASETYTGPFTLKEAGYHTLSYYATDHISNRKTGTFSVVVDNVGPSIEINFNQKPIGTIDLASQKEILPVFDRKVKLELLSSDLADKKQVLYYKIDKGDYQVYTAPVVVSTKGGVVTLQSKAIDALGNESESAPKIIFVE